MNQIQFVFEFPHIVRRGITQKQPKNAYNSKKYKIDPPKYIIADAAVRTLLGLNDLVLVHAVLDEAQSCTSRQ